MARREINIFGTSFLDLLSGALGAVIILFFIVPKIVPDVYTVFAKVYDGSRGTNANIAATFIFHPGKEDESRYEIPSVSVSKQKNTWFVTFRLTDSGFEILPLREPIWGGGKVIR